MAPGTARIRTCSSRRIEAGYSGYAESFGRGAGNVAADDGYDALVGMRLEYPVLNRAARAQQNRAETEKFRVGKSTSLLVAQAQRDLLASQINQVQAVVAYLKSLINLHLQEGALLERRGIVAPGATPVELDAKR